MAEPTKPILITIDVTRSDPKPLFNAFGWWMHYARQAGLCPPAEYEMIEKLMNGDVGFLHYSTIGGGTFAITLSRDEMGCIDTDEEFDETLEFVKAMAQRRRARKLAKEADKFRAMVEADIYPAKAMSASGQDQNGLGAQPASAVGETDLP